MGGPGTRGGAGIGPRIDPAIARAAAFIREHVTEPLSVAEIAEEVGYSEHHFIRRFSAQIGAPPGRYLAAWRFQAAKALLLREELPVLDACHEVGYSSPGTFTRRFTAEVGVAPAGVRRVADRLSERDLAPFRRMPPPGDARGSVVVDVVVPPEHRTWGEQAPLVWVGLFPRPVPSGPPITGLLRHGEGPALLPVPAGPAWLLATCVPPGAGPLDHLLPAAPLTAGHPRPVSPGLHVRLTLAPAADHAYPLLVALPSFAP